jgi:hypothetical protein
LKTASRADNPDLTPHRSHANNSNFINPHLKPPFSLSHQDRDQFINNFLIYQFRLPFYH